MQLDWNLIRSFVAVAETGSLSAAARRIGAGVGRCRRRAPDVRHRIVRQGAFDRRGKTEGCHDQAPGALNRHGLA